MRPWIAMLGGMLVWAAHFMGIYLIASVADVVAQADAAAARWIIGGYTALCAAAAAMIGVALWRRSRNEQDAVGRFIAFLGVGFAGVAVVAVLWQGLPALVGH